VFDQCLKSPACSWFRSRCAGIRRLFTARPPHKFTSTVWANEVHLLGATRAICAFVAANVCRSTSPNVARHLSQTLFSSSAICVPQPVFQGHCAPPFISFCRCRVESKKSVFPAKNYVDSVPASFAVSSRAKLFGRLPLELHLTLFPQGNRERKVRSHN